MLKNQGVTRRALVQALGAAPLAAAIPAVRAQNRSKVVVVGAGLSGLNAALLLEEQGLDVQVIEGRERVGGRVFSQRGLPGSPESGGTSFGAGYARLVDACRKYGVGMIDVTPIVPYFMRRELFLDGQPVPLSAWPTHPRNPLPEGARETPPWVYLNPLIRKSNPLKTTDGWLEPKNAAYDISLHDWLLKAGASPEVIELCWNTNPNFGTTAHDVSAMMVLFADAFALMQQQLGGKTFGYTAVGGNQSIPEAMAGALRKEIHFGRNVTGLRTSDSGAEVHCADGTVYRADYVVCSMPMSVLRRVAVDPLFTGPKHEAVNTLSSQPLNMVHLEVRKPFWESDGLNPNMFGDSLAGMIVAERKGATPEQVTSLTIWVRGRNATWMDTLDRNTATAAVMADFYRLRPAAKGQVEPHAYHSWYCDQFSAGDWAVWAPGQVRAFAASVGQPHGRIHFCGEHTAVSNRGMEGAMESGERAAFEILNLA